MDSLTTPAGRFTFVLDRECPNSNKLSELPGIGKTTVQKLEEKGICSKVDLLYLVPRSYKKIYRFFKADFLVRYRIRFALFYATVVDFYFPRGGSRAPHKVTVSSGNTEIELVWFHAQQISFLRKIQVGQLVRIDGQIDHSRNRPQMTHPLVETVVKFPDVMSHILIEPVYPTVGGITGKRISENIVRVAKDFLPYIQDILPEDLRRLNNLPSVVDAFRWLHLLDDSNKPDVASVTLNDIQTNEELSPSGDPQRFSYLDLGRIPFVAEDSSEEELFADTSDIGLLNLDCDPASLSEKETQLRDRLTRARQRLIYEEFYTLQKKLVEDYVRSRSIREALRCTVTPLYTEYRAALPFPLTNDQENALATLTEDLGRPVAMRRLVQGDVGSGKTVVALGAAVYVIGNGGQVAFMAPTDVLAKQHYRKTAEFLSHLPIRTRLLTGSQSVGERRVILEELRNNEIDLLIGTHALFQEVVEFAEETTGTISDQAKRSSEKDLAKRGRTPGGRTQVGSSREQSLDLFSANVLTVSPPVNEPVESARPSVPPYGGLALVIVDEQHKFGVEQRERLLAKGKDPHLLAMTATPIPRTMAHAFFGDLDLTVIREKPPGRQPIRTVLRDQRARDKMYPYMRSLIEERHTQIYVVFPLIEPSEAMPNTPSLIESAEWLANGMFRSLRVGILHGRMSGDDKNEVMERFSRHELDVLCSTTVIEVGVDVPNATVMIIEGAEHFGLSQLHQLRGRVGRGSEASMCVLIASGPMEESTAARLTAFSQTDDGFELAETDLKQRGAGEFLGYRQTGISEFRYGNLVRDVEWLEKARRDVRRAVLGDLAE